MPELWEVEEEQEDTETAARMRLVRVGREADFVEPLVGDLKEGRVNLRELPTLLENLGARLAKLARPASSRRDIDRYAERKNRTERRHC